MSDPIECFIEHKWWTVLEAAFVLTKWPEYEMLRTYITPKEAIPEDVRNDRPYFFLPGAFPFDPALYGKEYLDTYELLMKDINNGKLVGRYLYVEEGVTQLIKPIDVVLWALRKKYTLPIALQEALLIRQLKQAQEDPWHKKVKVMIVAQYYKTVTPAATATDIINCHWMKKYGACAENENQIRQLRKDIEIVLGKGKPGRRKETQDDTDKLTLKTIPQVLMKRRTYFDCDFTLLDTVIRTVALLHSQELTGLDSFRNVDIIEFTDLMRKDKIIKLYSRGMPQIIEKFIERSIKDAYAFIHELLFWENSFKGLLERKNKRTN